MRKQKGKRYISWSYSSCSSVTAVDRIQIGPLTDYVQDKSSNPLDVSPANNDASHVGNPNEEGRLQNQASGRDGSKKGVPIKHGEVKR